MYIQNLITMNNTDIKIYGKFVNELVDNKLADAKQIYDEDYVLIHPEDGESVGTGNFQNKINKDLKESITDIQTTIGDPEKDITCKSITVTTPNDADGNATGIGIYPGKNNRRSIVVGFRNASGNEYQCTHAGIHWNTNDGGIHVWPNKKVNDGIATLMVGSNAQNQSKHSAGMVSNDTLSEIWADRIKVDTISTDNGHINISDIATHSYVDDKTAAIDTKINKIIAGDVDLTGYALKTDLSNYALKSDISKYALKTDIPTVPTKISQLTNDSGYITSSEDVNTTNKSLKFDSSANSNNMNLTLTVTDSDNKSISDDIKLEKANSETAGLMGAVDRNYITFLLNKVNELESRVNKLSTSGDDSQTENVDISRIPYIAIRDNLKNINGIFSGTGYAAFPTKTDPTIQSAIAYKNNSSFNSEMVATFPDLVINANELKVYKLVNNNTSYTIGDTVEFDFTMGETRFTNCTGTVKEWTISHIVDSDEYKTVLGTFTINNINIPSQSGTYAKPNTKNTNRQYYTVNGNSDYFVSQFKAGKSYTITYTSSDVSKVNFKNTHIVNQDNASASTGADEISVGNIGSTKDGIVITPTINVTSQSDTKLEFTIAIPSDVYCINEIIYIQYNGYRDVSLIYNY